MALATQLTSDAFGQRLNHYGEWRRKITGAIESYQRWYDTQGKTDSDEELRLYELIESLHNDTLTIAMVGEFSRGKTELINAIFFPEYQRRLLPSTPGRTTMCPTEILYDPKLDPCIRLLPIETRKSALSISELKKTPINWTTLPLNLESAAQMAEVLNEIVKSKTVTAQEAEHLGLVSLAQEFERTGTEIEIPVWRHAIVNYPHRLLKQGLVILDTPGLNALGAEPELTLSMLPQAHAILFVLAADTGVTKTDMEVWKNHVCLGTYPDTHARIAALNKIDTLWDELHDEAETEGFIHRQAEETRRLLDIDRDMVFPVSAKKGLIGRIRNDEELLQKSGLLKLEGKLSEDVIQYKQKLIRDKLVNEIGNVVESSRSVVHTKIKGLEQQLTEISELRGKSHDVIDDMTNKLRKQKDIYGQEVQSFQVTRRVLSDQIKKLLGNLSMTRFDHLVAATRHSMRNSWTTQGLRHGMSTFFGGTARNMTKVEKQADAICELVDNIYDRFHREHGLPRMRPMRFSTRAFISQFKRLNDDAEIFRNSPIMLVTEQHFVIKKFFITIVSRARNIFNDCNTAARNWARAVLTPIYTQIQEHKIMIDRRLENLETLRGNHASLGERVRKIENELQDLRQQAKLIDDILSNISDPMGPQTELTS